MREQLQARLEILKREFHTGQARLGDLEREASALRETLLRISGAIQVLEEELAKADQPATNGVEQPNEETSAEKAPANAGRR
jgi:predicted nuclease with TOPRIM domain